MGANQSSNTRIPLTIEMLRTGLDDETVTRLRAVLNLDAFCRELAELVPQSEPIIAEQVVEIEFQKYLAPDQPANHYAKHRSRPINRSAGAIPDHRKSA